MSVSRSNFQCFVQWGALVIALIATSRPTAAMVLSRFDPLNPFAEYNITAPADDPGWFNVSHTGSSYVYLGDQWFLTASHVSAGTVNLANGSFNLIPGTNYQLTNPSGSYWQFDFEGKKVFAPLTSASDLRIFRVDTDTTTGLRPEDLNPGIKPITIASVSPAVGTDIVMMGIGVNRIVNLNDVNQEGLQHFQVDTNADPWDWGSPLNSGGNLHGFEGPTSNPTPPPRTKRWGTNQISPDSVIEQGYEIFDSNNNVVTTRWTPGGSKITDTLNLVAQFDQLGPNSDEALARAGDSGGPIFFKDASGQWQLGGIMNVIYQYPNQLTRRSIYGNLTAFADLSNPHYYQQIADKRAQSNYSIVGDINLDGIVSGNGTGAWESDDVTAFIQGWLYSQPEANILSWKKGDLNQDGVTDLSDFALLRTALGGSISNPEIQAFFGSGTSAVPEPQSWALMLGIWSGLMWLFRRRRLAPAPVRRRS